ncbi:flagellar protein [Bordetella genomosp. 1]|uniref:Flagellar protein n=1 Tax=Bordetella genomosp. 1 TaxID=1395607 RepID=A0A261SDV4_9BORD|nr:flagellar protein FlaG [Bordetella genomosp. 1]MDQ8033142.1 flagellar protein FlaG [Bordetella sp.]OZI35152.1 flagellar protein [Bordetella genomosp. 1]OZI63692.1 flagellar protein [Bordetella genomosp. 1]
MAVSPISTASHILPAVAPAPQPVDPAVASNAVAPTGRGQHTGNDSQPGSQPGANQSMEKALDDINNQLRAWSTELQFEIDPDVHAVVVSVLDSESGEVLRTIPSETVLRIAKMIVKMQGNAVQTTA